MLADNRHISANEVGRRLGISRAAAERLRDRGVFATERVIFRGEPIRRILRAEFDRRHPQRVHPGPAEALAALNDARRALEGSTDGKLIVQVIRALERAERAVRGVLL